MTVLSLYWECPYLLYLERRYWYGNRAQVPTWNKQWIKNSNKLSHIDWNYTLGTSYQAGSHSVSKVTMSTSNFCSAIQYSARVKKKENICRSNAQITFEFYDHFRCLQIDPLFQAITTFTKYCLTQWISKLPGTLSDTVFGKFHEFDGHSKRSGLQDRATFHKASALQIAIIFNTAVRYNTVQHDATRFNTIRRINTSNQYKAILRNNTIQYYETIQYIQHSTTQYNTCN